MSSRRSSLRHDPNNPDRSSGLDEDISSENKEDENQGVLYDILVFHEWNLNNQSEPNVINQSGDEQQQHEPAKSGLAQGISKLIFPLIPFLGRSRNSSDDLISRLEMLNKSKLDWKLAVSSDCTKVAILKETTLEILSHNNQEYIPVSRTRIEEESDENGQETENDFRRNNEENFHLRLLEWSEQADFLAMATGNGKVVIFNEIGDFQYTLVSHNLPSWEISSGTQENLHFTKIIFNSTRLSSSEWSTELILLHSKAQITTFLLSQTGYQETSSIALDSMYPSGVADAILVKSSSLLYVAGPHSENSHGISCWRMLEEDPFWHHAELLAEKSDSRFWSKFLSSKKGAAGANRNDFAFQMDLSANERQLVSVHVSGQISVWTVPALVKIWSIPLEEQACFDDINPQFLQNPNKTFHGVNQSSKVGSRWLPTALRWWSPTAIIVARLSGGLTILPVRPKTSDHPEDPVSNLIGDSAEFFSPGFQVSQRFESGFFVLECELEDSDEAEDLKKEGTDISSQEGLLANVKKSLWEIWSGDASTTDSSKVDQRSLNRTYRLLYFQSTSPDELFEKKLANEEYGEAIILARHYSLNCDRVYLRQWKNSDHKVIAIKDYLAKVQSLESVLKESLCTIPDDLDSAEELLRFGMQKLKVSSDLDQDFVDSCRNCFQLFADKLEVYKSVLEDESEFSASEFGEFRNLSLSEIAKKFALNGDLRSLKIILRRPELQSMVIETLNHVPESIDISDFLELIDSEEEKRQFIEKRSFNMISSSSIGCHALKMVNIGTDLHLVTDVRLNHLLSTFEAITVEKQVTNLTFEKMIALSDLQLLQILLQNESELTVEANFMKLAVPFLDRVEQCGNGTSVPLICDYVLSLGLTDFQLSAAILKLLIFHQDQTWLSQNDILSLGVRLVEQSDAEVNPREMIALVEFLSKKNRNAKDLELLLVQLNGLDVLRRRKIQMSLREMKSALNQLESAEELVGNLLAYCCKWSSNSPDPNWSETLGDVLTVQKSCDDEILTSDQCFQMFCQTLLELETERDINVVGELLKKSDIVSSSSPEVTNLRRTLQLFRVNTLSVESVYSMCENAAENYIMAARDLKDSKLILAQGCLDISSQAKDGGKCENLLEAIRIMRRISLKTNPAPRTLLRLKTQKDVIQFVRENVNFEKFNKSAKENILNVTRCVSKALEIPEFRYETISTMARCLIELSDLKSCEDLCLELVESGSGQGWEVCLDLARQKQSEDSSLKRKLFSISVAFCEPILIEEISEFRQTTEQEQHLNDSDFSVPGADFFENSLIFNRPVLDKSSKRDWLDIFDSQLKSFPRTLNADQLENIFLQDPLLGLAYLESLVESSENCSDSIALMKVLKTSLFKIWPIFGVSSLNSSVLQLSNVVSSDFIKSVVPKDNLTIASPMKKTRDVTEPKEDLDGQNVVEELEDKVEEHLEIMESEQEEEEEVLEVQGEVQKRFLEQVQSGVPRSLRTLFSNL